MRIPAFLAFLKSTSSVGQNIQTLILREGQRKDPYVNSPVLASLFPHLPCLHSLCLIDIAFRGAETPLPQLEPCHRIRSLSFRFKASESYTVQHVLDILGLFSHLDELRLSSDDPEGDKIIRVLDISKINICLQGSCQVASCRRTGERLHGHVGHTYPATICK
ncbi:hypothetical protein PHLCEN_2v13332 [Hermanssonia centrifuga]|uniref:Uncharacterized protein n=1 Tax=Hermanssonia centrifuga TaxID=98765 RepID=A0A2R6NET4_9APHY|nr:hypothetical protein PHLCEN_2v13332 [Hermanssonia centrifuga]